MHKHDCASLLAKLQPRFTCLLVSSTSPSCLCRLVDIFHGLYCYLSRHLTSTCLLVACARDNKKKPHSKAPRGSFNLNNRWMSALSLTSCLCQCAALNLVCCHVWRDDDSLVSCFLFAVVTKVRTFLFLNIIFFYWGLILRGNSSPNNTLCFWKTSEESALFRQCSTPEQTIWE